MSKYLILISMVMLTSCSLVDLSEAGRGVAVRAENQVNGCTRSGETTVSVIDRIGLQRSDERVREELEVLARNAAANRGDTIVPSGPEVDGVRTYAIYRCVQ